ncbi:hypothetical protein CAAN1_15S00892 [[Candida] anglica]|uniref:Ornithine cyclodeaminase n=1 Tax=[Candida] anglica TaxID=148631 RepID=A0ABP0E7V4_9ASCO
MKILSDDEVTEFLNSNLSKDSILDTFQPTLLDALQNYQKNPESIPPRVVQQSLKSDTTHLFMPCVSPEEVGIKLISGGPSNTQRGLGFQGAILVLDEDSGALKGVVNAKTITAFRTALATSLAMTAVLDPRDTALALLPSIAVFGVGAQAYWHIKLALALYNNVKNVKIINRTIENANELKQRMCQEFSNINFETYSYDQVRSEDIQQCSIIFGCTPSTTPVIKENYINTDKKYKKFIGLIGSYKPHMIELDLNFILKEYKNPPNRTKIIVDSKQHALHEAGELIQSGIDATQLVELTELSKANLNDLTTEDNITVSKIVGLSIMDISMAKFVLKESKNGVNIEEF